MTKKAFHLKVLFIKLVKLKNPSNFLHPDRIVYLFRKLFSAANVPVSIYGSSKH